MRPRKQPVAGRSRTGVLQQQSRHHAPRSSTGEAAVRKRREWGALGVLACCRWWNWLLAVAMRVCRWWGGPAHVLPAAQRAHSLLAGQARACRLIPERQAVAAARPGGQGGPVQPGRGEQCSSGGGGGAPAAEQPVAAARRQEAQDPQGARLWRRPGAAAAASHFKPAFLS